ncbi:hypothetical protein L1887_53508 [Cichorium endivia]|nr:hypothetical protein L1887_53508 [Cichorium endivia]
MSRCANSSRTCWLDGMPLLVVTFYTGRERLEDQSAGLLDVHVLVCWVGTPDPTGPCLARRSAAPLPCNGCSGIFRWTRVVQAGHGPEASSQFFLRPASLRTLAVSSHIILTGPSCSDCSTAPEDLGEGPSEPAVDMAGPTSTSAGAQPDVADAWTTASHIQSAGSLRIRKLSKVSPARFLLLSLLFHIVYISSIFDIYFTSPVVHPEPRFSVRDTLAPGHVGRVS